MNATRCDHRTTSSGRLLRSSVVSCRTSKKILPGSRLNVISFVRQTHRRILVTYQHQHRHRLPPLCQILVRRTDKVKSMAKGRHKNSLTATPKQTDTVNPSITSSNSNLTRGARPNDDLMMPIPTPNSLLQMANGSPSWPQDSIPTLHSLPRPLALITVSTSTSSTVTTILNINRPGTTDFRTGPLRYL